MADAWSGIGTLVGLLLGLGGFVMVDHWIYLRNNAASRKRCKEYLEKERK